MRLFGWTLSWEWPCPFGWKYLQLRQFKPTPRSSLLHGIECDVYRVLIFGPLHLVRFLRVASAIGKPGPMLDTSTEEGSDISTGKDWSLGVEWDPDGEEK